MSCEVIENPVRIADVDVDESMKENVLQEELSADSGAETVDTGSLSCPTSSDSEVSPTKHSDSPVSNYGTSSVVLSAEDNSPSKSLSESLSSKTCESPLPTDECPEKVDNTEILSTHKYLNSDDKEILQMQNSNINNDNNITDNNAENSQILISNESSLLQSNISIDNSKSDKNNKLFEIDNTNSKDDKETTANLAALTEVPDIKTNDSITTSEDSISKDEEGLFSKMDFAVANCNLTMSTTSLNNEEQTNRLNNAKLPFSRSVENISTMEENTPSSANSSTKHLNTDQILSEFTSQKNKVKATHKIINDTIPVIVNSDLKSRIPKEILSQDLGSIAKSVHGIFSSVSGSLKNAYNNSQKATSVKLPIKNIVRPVNGKVINDIFEDNVPENTCNVVSVADDERNEKDAGNSNLEENVVTQDVTTDDETKKDLIKLQIESLERVLAEQRKENSALRERVKQQVDELQAKDQTFKELESKVDLMCKRAEQAQREKDAAVMRYASVECAAIEARRAAEASARTERAAVAERDLLAAKLRSARDERERICRLYDDKCHELKNSELELGKLREEARELDNRLKWTQSKLRVEMDAYKESSERAEKLSQQLSELEAARGAAAVSAADAAKAKQLEAELKESQAALILCRHEKEELEKRWSNTAQRLDACKRERDEATAALALATAQVEKLKDSNLRLEEEAAELAALRAQAALADTLSSQLQRETERAAAAEAEVAREAARAETCARREAAALEHAARLTAAHVHHRAQAARAHAQTQALTADNASLRERVSALEEECGKLQTALHEETDRRNKENRVLARKVAELTEEVAEANKQLEWEKGENGVLKKKHASGIKELNRELHRAMKRVEQLEAKLPQPGGDAPSTRTGSITSLSSGEIAQDDRLQNGHADPEVQGGVNGGGGGGGGSGGGPVPERQALIERIVSLQRAAARRAERCEFLEEHARHLTEELRAKSRLLRHLLPALPAAQLHDTKQEMARLGGGGAGGAMAALRGGSADGMAPELALEVAARLQALLEDTLLKNITLKENMDTLGEEIARLRKQVNSANETK